MGSASRYHIAKQTDGRGWMIIRLSALHAGFANTTATVVECGLTECLARERLVDLRNAEATVAAAAALGNPPAPGGPR